MILTVWLDFQRMRIVFLVMIGAMESILLELLFRLMFDESPNKQSGGDCGNEEAQEREEVACDVPPE